MNLKKISAIILALALCLVSAMAFAEETDYEARIAELEAQLAERDARIAELEAQLAATNYVAAFDGGYVTVDEAMAQYEYVEYMYTSYGYSMEGYEDYFKNDIATTLLNDKIVQYMAAQLGLDTPTEEQAAQLTANAEANMQMYIESYRADFESEELTEEEIINSTTAFLAENGVTLDTLYEQELAYFVSDAVYEYIVSGVTVSDEDVQALYDEYVAQDQAAYADSYAYESAIMSGTAVYWHPEGYRNVRQVLVAFDDDQSARYDEITDRIYDLEAELAAAQAPADETADDEADEADETAEAPRAAEEIQADLDAASAELDALYAELEPTAATVIAEFDAGAPIDELIATYGGDPGSINADGTTNTYSVSAASIAYDQGFIDAAMSVEEIGGLSAPERGMYGLYIVYYDSDVTSGAVAYEAVQEELSALALENARAEAYDAQLAAWSEELNVVYYLENFR